MLVWQFLPVPLLRRIVITTLAFVVISRVVAPADCFGRGGQALKAVMGIVAAYSAGKTAEEAGISLEVYWDDAARPGESIYSITYSFQEVSWADWWSRPDVFAVIEWEGNNRIFIPDIEYNWDYAQKTFTFRSPTLPAGSKGTIRLYDDDETTDHVWKTILSNRVSWSVDAGVGSTLPGSGVTGMAINSTAYGDVKLLDIRSRDEVMLDSPDPVAVATFTTPVERTDTWRLKGSFNHRGRQVGQVSFTHWHTNMSPRWIGYVFRPRMLFWVFLLGGIIGVCIWLRDKPGPSRKDLYCGDSVPGE